MKRLLHAAFIIATIFLVGCAYSHQFQVGDEVVSKLDGRKGVVISLDRNSDRVYVRFNRSYINYSVLNMRQSPYVEVLMKEAELKRFK